MLIAWHCGPQSCPGWLAELLDVCCTADCAQFQAYEASLTTNRALAAKVSRPVLVLAFRMDSPKSCLSCCDVFDAQIYHSFLKLIELRCSSDIAFRDTRSVAAQQVSSSSLLSLAILAPRRQFGLAVLTIAALVCCAAECAGCPHGEPGVPGRRRRQRRQAGMTD